MIGSIQIKSTLFSLSRHSLLPQDKEETKGRLHDDIVREEMTGDGTGKRLVMAEKNWESEIRPLGRASLSGLLRVPGPG